MLAMLSQSLINLVDAALMGPLGASALAAVGAGSYASFVTVSVLSGLSAAVQAQVARREGAGRFEECAVPVNHGLLIALVFALPISLLFYGLSPWLLDIFSPVAHHSTEFSEDALHYFQIRVLTLTAVAMSLSFRGFWNGMGKPSIFSTCYSSLTFAMR